MTVRGREWLQLCQSWQIDKNVSAMNAKLAHRCQSWWEVAVPCSEEQEDHEQCAKRPANLARAGVLMLHQQLADKLSRSDKIKKAGPSGRICASR